LAIEIAIFKVEGAGRQGEGSAMPTDRLQPVPAETSFKPSISTEMAGQQSRYGVLRSRCHPRSNPELNNRNSFLTYFIGGGLP
jgi:hypothetical protein